MSYAKVFHGRRNLIILVAVVALLFVAGFAFRNKLATVGKVLGVVPVSGQEVLDKLMEHPEMKDYAGWDSEVTHLSSQDIKNLAKKQPVIYGDVDGDLYRVTLKSGSSGLLVLFDYNSNMIVKQFEMLNVQLA